MYHMVPMAVLLSTLITLIILSRNREIVAMKASGISLFSICSPILLVSLLISLLLLILNESIIPYSIKKSEYIENVLINKEEPVGLFKENQIWYKSPGAIYNIRLFDPKKNILKGITINYFDKNFYLTRRIDGKEARWKPGQGWIFYEVIFRSRQKDGSFKLESFPEKSIPLPESPRDFKKVERKPEEMTFTELKDYIRQIKSEGYDATRYLVDLHFKTSFPFISFIMAILGAPFALKAEKGGGVTLGVGISIIIGFSYYLIYAFNQSLGHAEILPPIVSAWLTNALFGTIGILLFLGTPR